MKLLGRWTYIKVSIIVNNTNKLLDLMLKELLKEQNGQVYGSGKILAFWK